jgi:hypothetical protein
MSKIFLKEFTYQYILLHDNLTKDEKLQIGKFVKEASEEQIMALLLSGKCKPKLQEKEEKFVKKLFEASDMSQILTKGGEFIGKASKVGVTGQTSSTGWVKKLASMWANYRVEPAKSIGFGDFKVSTHADYSAWKTAYDQATTAIKHGAPVAALVMAALVSLVATKLYKSYISKAARACKGQASSELKKACMRKYAINGLEMKVRALQNGIKACDSAKNPGKCRDSVNSKIAKAKAKLNKAQSK